MCLLKHEFLIWPSLFKLLLPSCCSLTIKRNNLQVHLYLIFFTMFCSNSNLWIFNYFGNKPGNQFTVKLCSVILNRNNISALQNNSSGLGWWVGTINHRLTCCWGAFQWYLQTVIFDVVLGWHQCVQEQKICLYRIQWLFPWKVREELAMNCEFIMMKLWKTMFSFYLQFKYLWQ